MVMIVGLLREPKPLQMLVALQKLENARTTRCLPAAGCRRRLAGRLVRLYQCMWRSSVTYRYQAALDCTVLYCAVQCCTVDSVE